MEMISKDGCYEGLEEVTPRPVGDLIKKKKRFYFIFTASTREGDREGEEHRHGTET